MPNGDAIEYFGQTTTLDEIINTFGVSLDEINNLNGTEYTDSHIFYPISPIAPGEPILLLPSSKVYPIYEYDSFGEIVGTTGYDTKPSEPPEPDPSDNPYLYDDQFAEEGLGASIDEQIFQNIKTSIQKVQTLAAAVDFHGVDTENPALHAFYEGVTDPSIRQPFETAKEEYQYEVLATLMDLYVQSENQIDITQLLEGVEFNGGSEANLTGLTDLYIAMDILDVDLDLHPDESWLRDNISNIDIGLVQELLKEQIDLSAGDLPNSVLSDADYLISGYEFAEELDTNYEDVVRQAIADVEAWDGEAEQQQLDTLMAAIQVMHTTGGYIVSVDVRPIIGAFERYHAAMTNRQTMMASLSDYKDQLDYLNMTYDEKIEYHKHRILQEYFDHFELPYDAELNSDELYDLMRAGWEETSDLSLNEYLYYWRNLGRTISLFGAKGIPISGIINHEAYWAVHEDELAVLNFAGLFFIGFVPIVGQAADFVDFISSLLVGDAIGALTSFIPMIGEIGRGLRGVSRSATNLIHQFPDDFSKYASKVKELDKEISKISNYLNNISQHQQLQHAYAGQDPSIVSMSDNGSRRPQRQMGLDEIEGSLFPPPPPSKKGYPMVGSQTGVNSKNSTILGDRMVASGTVKLVDSSGEAYHAHHIIPSIDEAAADLRDRLWKEWEIDINDPLNGVFLPRSYHLGIVHAGKKGTYIKWVLDQFKGIVTREEAIETLNEIRDHLSNQNY